MYNKTKEETKNIVTKVLENSPMKVHYTNNGKTINIRAPRFGFSGSAENFDKAFKEEVENMNTELTLGKKYKQ